MAEIKRYAVIDESTGKVVNIILWDGVSGWSPPEGCSVREATADDQINAEE
jgi:hypothetical protein